MVMGVAYVRFVFHQTAFKCGSFIIVLERNPDLSERACLIYKMGRVTELSTPTRGRGRRVLAKSCVRFGFSQVHLRRIDGRNKIPVVCQRDRGHLLPSSRHISSLINAS